MLDRPKFKILLVSASLVITLLSVDEHSRELDDVEIGDRSVEFCGE